MYEHYDDYDAPQTRTSADDYETEADYADRMERREAAQRGARAMARQAPLMPQNALAGLSQRDAADAILAFCARRNLPLSRADGTLVPPSTHRAR